VASVVAGVASVAEAAAGVVVGADGEPVRAGWI